jgi:hypothetical protein
VKRIDTQLGTLVLDDHVCPNRLKAELRGLELLCSIVNSTPIWSLETGSQKPFIVSNDNGPTVLIDIFESIRKKVCEGDPHITVYMSQRPVCILRDSDVVDTPSTDSLVSLVLLGIAGWPIDSTPPTLGQKSIMASSVPIEDTTALSTADYNQIQSALHLQQEGFTHAGLSVLAQMARRLYVCRIWHIDKIKLILQPILESFEDAQLQRYLRNPDEETDVLFLTL